MGGVEGWVTAAELCLNSKPLAQTKSLANQISDPWKFHDSAKWEFSGLASHA